MAIRARAAPPPQRGSARRLSRRLALRGRRNRGGRSGRRTTASRVLIGAAVLLAVATAWVGFRGTLAARHLVLARAALITAKQSLLAGDETGARERLASLRTKTAAARRLTGDPVWAVYRRIPGLGASMSVVRGVTVAVDDLAADTLPELFDVGLTVAPKSLRVRGDTVNVDALGKARPGLLAASADAEAIAARLDALPRTLVVQPIGAARDELLAEVRALADVTRTGALFAELGPPMLGQNGVRRYLMAVQSNAEARATGGLLGAYGIIEARDGRIALTKTGTNSELANTFPTPAVDLGREFGLRYDRFASRSFWINGNMSPHFPAASRIWLALYEKTTGQRLDGVIGVDPVAMRYLLSGTGPATLPNGEPLTSEQVVDFTMRDAYTRFPDNYRRDQFLQVVARRVFDQLISGSGDSLVTVTGLATAAKENHLQLYSTVATEQQRLEATPIAGALPETPGAYLQVVTQNSGGNKLDYYLRRQIRYDSVPHPSGGRRVKVVVRLRNTAPEGGLPAYVVGRLDLPNGRAAIDGQGRVYLSVYCGVGCALERALLNGSKTLMESEVERGHGVFSTFLDVDPGKDTFVELVYREPDGTTAPPTVRQQPLVVPDDLDIGDS